MAISKTKAAVAVILTSGSSYGIYEIVKHGSSNTLSKEQENKKNQSLKESAENKKTEKNGEQRETKKEVNEAEDDVEVANLSVNNADNEDTSFCDKFHEGTLGNKFKNNLICAIGDKEWEKRVEHWKTNLGEANRHSTLSKFNVRNIKNANIKNLQTRCENSLKVLDWKADFKKNKEQEKNQHWAEVKIYCTKPGTTIENWNPQ
ncbi:hypothetical protein [Candidatus Mycoplasma haematohominis]|uniref:Uncharacterized protein n=1 Tax=Candidatus Mycoplasma haematohominis TaxID=1494318 RepID=A0A478FRK5_9MOLU|nr:hypothetical protein [Candidatus Mycoplasma haemohominis]GCE63817.1 hypothetical protein MHSWG343_08240 [Candidatus Mycoplasma haemohominis]